jgi:lysophospholipase L1-like esterase
MKYIRIIVATLTVAASTQLTSNPAGAQPAVRVWVRSGANLQNIPLSGHPNASYQPQSQELRLVDGGAATLGWEWPSNCPPGTVAEAWLVNVDGPNGAEKFRYPLAFMNHSDESWTVSKLPSGTMSWLPRSDSAQIENYYVEMVWRAGVPLVGDLLAGAKTRNFKILYSGHRSVTLGALSSEGYINGYPQVTLPVSSTGIPIGGQIQIYAYSMSNTESGILELGRSSAGEGFKVWPAPPAPGWYYVAATFLNEYGHPSPPSQRLSVFVDDTGWYTVSTNPPNTMEQIVPAGQPTLRIPIPLEMRPSVFQFTPAPSRGPNEGPTLLQGSASQSNDTTPPSIPANLLAAAVSTSQINLTWHASTDNPGGAGLAGYKIYRNGKQVATSVATSFSDNGLAANTAYTYTVAAYDASHRVNTSAQSASASATTFAAPSTLTYSVQAGDLWDNGFDNVNAPRQSAFARFVFTATAPALTITGTTTIVGSYPQWAHLGVRVNGIDQPPLVFTANGTRSFTLNLPGSPGTNTVELIAGLQSNPGGSPLGTFIDSVAYVSTTSLAVQPPTIGNRILIYAESIAVGADAANPESQGYPVLLRNSYGLRVAVDGWGYRSLYDDAATTNAINTLVAHFASYHPSTILIPIGANDYGLNRWSAADFGNAYGAVLDALQTAMPTVRLVCLTPTVRVKPAATGPNAFGPGNALSDYIAQVTNVCGARSSWTNLTLIDSTNILFTTDLDTDGVHPTTAGQTNFAARIAPYLQ